MTKAERKTMGRRGVPSLAKLPREATPGPWRWGGPARGKTSGSGSAAPSRGLPNNGTIGAVAIFRVGFGPREKVVIPTGFRVTKVALKGNGPPEANTRALNGRPQSLSRSRVLTTPERERSLSRSRPLFRALHMALDTRNSVSLKTPTRFTGRHAHLLL